MGRGEGDSKQESLDYLCLGFDVFFAFEKCRSLNQIKIRIEANKDFCLKNGQIAYLIIAVDSSNPENTK